MTNFLMISPYFPPMKNVGAKRALSFARHLPSRGFSPAVLALPIGENRDPALEPFMPDVPVDHGYRSGPIAWALDRTSSPQNRLQKGDPRAANSKPVQGLFARLKREFKGLPIDRYAKFLPWALGRAEALIEAHDCKLIHVNAGPFSGMYLGHALAVRTGLPLVLDLRDPWAVDPIYSEAWGAVGQAMAKRLEEGAFKHAAQIVINSASALRRYQMRYVGTVPLERFALIRNHFDPGMLAERPAPPGPDGPFRVVFFGHLTPTRNGELFFEAYRRFIDAEGLAPGEIELITLGHRSPIDDAAIAELSLGAYVQNHDWMAFTEAPALLGTADLLLDLTSPRHHLRIAGKTYDYLYARRPILSVSANREMDAILGETRTGERVDHAVDAIVAGLGRALAIKRGQRDFAPDAAAIHQFSAEPAADKMAAIFRKALS